MHYKHVPFENVVICFIYIITDIVCTNRAYELSIAKSLIGSAPNHFAVSKKSC